MAWKLLLGWKYSRARSDAEKLHDDMLDYDALPPSVQENDRLVVHAIPNLLRLGRLGARHVTQSPVLPTTGTI
jgi:hypothetical protein